MPTREKQPWRLRQIATMGWVEFRTRSQQELTKRWDAVRYRLGLPPDRSGLSSHSLVPARFFFAASDLPQLITLLRKWFPHEAAHLVEQAERICKHRFDLLGYRELDYGEKIDWHFDAVHRKRAPRRPWFRIPFLDFDTVGDAKIVWELNRHQHFVTLAKAYCVTREERFVDELLRQWYHWQQENPYPIGINWASSLEVAFRSLSWLWVQHLLGNCSSLPGCFQSDLLRGLALNGRHIERYLSTYFSPNTHLLGEGVALFFIGTLCPQLRRAPRWQQRGWEIVLREAERQVQPDGMHFEQSIYYHVYALDFLLHARLLACCNQVPIPAKFDQTLERMLEILCALGQAGRPPQLSDDDGGRVFNPQRNHAEHLLDPLATGAVLFGRSDFKAVAGGLREETLWLLGREGVAQFEQIPAIARLQSSTHFESSGLYVMADAEPVAQLVIDAGPQGTGMAGHSHADALSVHLTVEGRECLIDPGTFVYVGEALERNLFRGTSAHNTLQVDKCDQAEAATPVGWRSLPKVQVEHWVVGKTFDLFVGSHRGYCRLPEPVVHRRCVFHLKSRFWLVRDLALGAGIHQLDLFWHLVPGRLRASLDTKATLLSVREDLALVLLPMEDHNWVQGNREGWWSPVYGRREPSPILHFGTQAALPAEFATLLFSVGKVSEELGTLRRIRDPAKHAQVVGYQYKTPLEMHFMFFAERGHSWALGPWASDAQFIYYGVAPARGRRHLVLCEGSYLDVGGRRTIACKRPVGRIEWISTGTTAELFCSDEAALSHLDEEIFSEAETVILGADALRSRKGAD